MNLTNATAARRLPALFAVPFCLLGIAVLILLGPARAEAELLVDAKVSAATPETVWVTARTSLVAKRIDFFVDGQKGTVARSVRWRHGRKGALAAENLQPGRHRLTAVAVDSRGRVSRAARIIRLRQRNRQRSPRIAVRPSIQVSDPGSKNPEILFDGGFDSGFDGWHVQALSNRVGTFDVGAFSGSAAHFEVHEGDIEPETGSQRAEVSGPTFHEGQEIYVRDTIRVPSSSNFNASWQLIQQLRENDWGGSPGTAVFLEDDRELKIGAGDSTPMFWKGPVLQPDRWYDLVYRVMLSQDPSVGFVEVWLDGVRQEMLNGETRIYGQTIQRPSNYIKAGIYRSKSSTGTSVVEHDNVIVGNSYEAVMAAG